MRVKNLFFDSIHSVMIEIALFMQNKTEPYDRIIKQIT